MMARKRSRAGASLRAEPCSVSMKPDSEASGVRSSWLALATKSARISSTRRSGVRSRRVSSTRSGLTASARFYRHHDGFEPTVERHALEINDALLFVFRRRAADGLDQFRHAQGERDRFALLQCRRQRAGAPIERQHATATVESDDRIRQTGDHGPQ